MNGNYLLQSNIVKKILNIIETRTFAPVVTVCSLILQIFKMFTDFMSATVSYNLSV